MYVHSMCISVFVDLSNLFIFLQHKLNTNPVIAKEKKLQIVSESIMQHGESSSNIGIFKIYINNKKYSKINWSYVIYIYH